MWIWNHPLRLRKPLKRIGEKGEGKFKEITWDEALNEIGAKVKDLVQKYGESQPFAHSLKIMRCCCDAAFTILLDTNLPATLRV